MKPLATAYRWPVEQRDIDATVLIDGGIDALLRGDETSLGTPADDLASLAAVHALEVPIKLLACVSLEVLVALSENETRFEGRIAELGDEQSSAEMLIPARSLHESR